MLQDFHEPAELQCLLHVRRVLGNLGYDDSKFFKDLSLMLWLLKVYVGPYFEALVGQLELRAIVVLEVRNESLSRHFKFLMVLLKQISKHLSLLIILSSLIECLDEFESLLGDYVISLLLAETDRKLFALNQRVALHL